MVAAGVLAARVAAANTPVRLVNVHVSFKRTITHTETDVEKQPCGTKTTNSFQTEETVTLDSPAYPMTDDTNRIRLAWKTTRMPDGSKPLVGSGEISVHAEKHQVACHSTEDDVGGGAAKLDLDHTVLSLEFERKQATGTLDVKPAWRDTSGAGTFRSQVENQPPTTVDGSAFYTTNTEAMAGWTGMLSLSTPAQWAGMGPAAEMLRKDFQPLAMDEPVMIAPSGSGFEIHYSVTRTLDPAKLNPPPPTIDRSGTHTVHTELSITIGGPPLEYDAIIVPVTDVAPNLGDYAKWVPIGTRPSDDEGKNDGVAFRVILVRKDKPKEKVSGVPFQVRWQLETSHEPGYAINMPLDDADTKPDLEWDATMRSFSGISSVTDTVAETKADRGDAVPAIIRSRDFGAYGKLSAHVRLVAGGEINAHLEGESATEVTLPRDDDHNHVADAWERGAQVNHEAGWDGETTDKNANDGDGLSYYEEYRGAFVGGKHIRLGAPEKDGKKASGAKRGPSGKREKKDVFILNLTKRDLSKAAETFENATGGSVKIRFLRPDEIKATDMLINRNVSTANNGHQHAIKVEEVATLPPEAAPGTAAWCKPSQPLVIPPGAHRVVDNAATSPGSVEAIYVHVPKKDKKMSKSELADVDFAIQEFDHDFAHELGHALGIHHHGDSADALKGGYTDTPIIDESGQWLGVTTIGEGQDVARPYSPASGDTTCLMVYNHFYDAVDSGLSIKDVPAAMDKLGGKAKVGVRQNDPVLVKTPFWPDGTTLCTGDDDKGINAKGHVPPVFGPAKRGNCLGQMMIKDY